MLSAFLGVLDQSTKKIISTQKTLGLDHTQPKINDDSDFKMNTIVQKT